MAGKAKPATDKQDDGVEIPLGIGATLPAEDLQGTLIPLVALTFDPAPGDVSSALAAPKSLTVAWPIKGKVPNLHDVTLPARLIWQVMSADEKSVLRSTPAAGEAKMKVDGSGRFEIQIADKAPVLDMIAAGLVGNGKVTYQVALSSPPGVPVQNGPDKLAFNLGCSVEVSTTPPTTVRLGDSAHYKATAMHGLLKKIPLELRIVEQDDTDAHGAGDTVAFRREFKDGGIKPFDWTIGFADPDGSWARFSYSEDFEEGNFEYGWQLFAKAPSTGEWTPILASAAPFTVEKPKLEKFELVADDAAAGTWKAQGQITGFSTDAPHVRVALAIVDATGQRFPADLARSPQAALDKHGNFQQVLAGPKVTPAPTGETAPAAAFAILSLVPTWDSKGEAHPVSGFLGYDENVFALYDPAHSTSWANSCAWIASQGALAIAPRGAKGKSGGGIPAPGPGDAASQSGPLTFDEHIVDTIAWEGEIPHLYLDSRGYMTVGIGTCLVTEKNPRDPSRALKLPFKNLETNAKADEKEIKAAFDKVLAMPPKLEASKYATYPKLELEDKDIRALVRSFFDTALSALRTNFPEFDTFPKCARRALLDIVYNCGPAFFNAAAPKAPAKAPKMRAAVLAKKWDVAANEVPAGGRTERRQWRMELLMFAHRLSSAKLEPTT